MDSTISRWPKRRRLDHGEEQVQRNDYHDSTTWSQPDFQLQTLPAATAQQCYERRSYGNLESAWNGYSRTYTSVDNVMNYHMGGSNGYHYYHQHTPGIGPRFTHANDAITQGASFSDVPLHPHAPLQVNAPMFGPLYQQYPLYGPHTDQPATATQQCAQHFVQSALPQSVPYYSGLSQNTTFRDESSSALPDQDVVGSEIVCFGMIPSIAAKCDQRETAHRLPVSFSVVLEGSTRFSSKELSTISGQILPEHGEMIQDLLDQTCLELYASCIISGFQAVDTGKSPCGLSTIPCRLEISVYGPVEIFEELGNWFEYYQVYLQDPRECHRQVRYCNPHRLSTDDISTCPLLADVISQSSSSLELESIAQQSDLLDELCSHENLEEAPQPSVIKHELKRHQKQALTFMMRREQGWTFSDQDPDIWEIRYTGQGRRFLNRVSGVSQTEEPPQCYGGIVADPMGLGKTLTMIALVATDLSKENEDDSGGEDAHLRIPTTLIVVPPSLIGTWEEQLSEHVMEDCLTCHLYHRKGRNISLNDLEETDIVLTTYHTISSEWNSSNNGKDSVLFSVYWKRIILDEAHLIRNGNSRMAQAIYALESRSRWAVTGTPIQNRLGDLASLFKFIRVHPYTDRRCFEADVSQLWKNGEYQEAIKRLKRLSKCLILRRDKSTISLPPRQDLQCPVNFSPEEQTLYNNLRDDTKAIIDEATNRDPHALKPGGYVHILQRIESLRLVCNIGLHYHTRHDKVIQTIQGTNEWSNTAQRAFNMQRDITPIICLLCSTSLDTSETISEGTATVSQSPLFFSCLSFVCTECAQKYRQIIECGHNPCCAVARISTSGESLETSLSEIQPQTGIGLPSKVKALITDIKNMPPNEKCVVFSTWRLTLGIIEAGLAESGISSVRFDGKVPQKSRQSVVDRFRNQRSIRVMLLTLSCGAAGLTLTEATRAYLMEPHWNPTIEEQALARIHRIGQTREVTTVRFFMRDSFEQNVMKIQESKKHLAGLLLSSNDEGCGSENVGRLQELSALI